MPTDAREQAYGALWTVLNGISAIDSRSRDLAIPVDFTESAADSWLVMIDGSEERRPDQQQGALWIDARCEVWLAARAASTALLATALNDLRAKVLVAVYADRTLGQKVAWVEYEGATAPDIHGDAIGAVMLTLVLIRTESDSDPYSLG